MRYVLASSSPRRKDLMKFISSDFLIDVSNVDEVVEEGLSPTEVTTHIAYQKGCVVANRHKDDIVISADTIVVIDDLIIGKPKDEEDAKRILKLLSGRTHYVHTAFYIFYKDKALNGLVTSNVIFNEIDDKLIDEYVKSKSPLDKAGAYGFQDNEKYPLVHHVEGSIDNVIGFPVKEIKEKIQEMKQLFLLPTTD